ncbi:PAC2 family protein [Candidatus Woesearchaeota archaeon]|nr:PAC2 family protein [Candidatus Woesearchaeota archaeon]MBW2978579.1 PAC2 family protein [Candidatus Woesearchaeota archaeon]
MWKLNKTAQKLNIRKPILIEGLPGIGNVGKVAVDFIIDDLNAKKIGEFESDFYPNSVFVNEKNLVELPRIEIYHKELKKKRHDLLLLSGDVQPVEEAASYRFSESVIKLLQNYNGQQIITLGGVALKEIPKKPAIYCTGNCLKTIKKYSKGMKINQNIYGAIGPIVGVSGLLLGLAKKHKIPAVTLLAETYAHPMYLGVNGAKEILRILNKKIGINVNISELEKEIKELEEEIQKDHTLSIKKPARLKKLKRKIGEMSYIG